MTSLLRHLAPGLICLLFLTTGAFPFAVQECDQDDTPGNAGIVLGWSTPTASGMGSILIDTLGAPSSGLTTAQVDLAWASSIADWESTTSTAMTFGSTSSQAITSDQIDVIAVSNGERIWMVIEPSTAQTNGTTGWTKITGTDVTSILGITLVGFDKTTRLLTDGDVLINDDRDAGAIALAVGGAVPANSVSLESVISHELGHFLGAAHTQKVGSLMNPGIPKGIAKPLGEDDRDLVRFLYPTLAIPPQPENDLSFQDCFNVAASGEILAAGHPGGCQSAPGTSSAASALILLWGSFFLIGWRRHSLQRDR
jgi:hypothetical protein